MRAFTGLTFTTTGFTPDEQDTIRHTIISHGGSFCVDVISSTTHIVVAFGATKKCLVARQLGSIQLVTEKWLEKSIESPAGSPSISLPDECFAKPLTGYVVCVTEIAPAERVNLRDKVEQAGGKYQGHLDPAVTHLIVPKTFDWKTKNSNAKIVFAEKHNISIVYECWISTMQSGFIVETEVTDICRATPFYDVNDALEVIHGAEQSTSAPGEHPVVEPYTAAEALQFCQQRVQEGVWGQKSEEGVQSTVYAAFRSAFSSSIPDRNEPSSPLLSSRNVTSPILAAAVASQRKSQGGRDSLPQQDSHSVLQNFIGKNSTANFCRHIRAYFVDDGADGEKYSGSGLFPSYRDPLLRLFSQPNKSQNELRTTKEISENNSVVPMMKRALTHALGIPMPFLCRSLTHVIVPLVDGKPKKLSLEIESRLKSACEELYFPLSRVLTGQWLIDSVQKGEALPCEGYGYPFGASEVSSGRFSSQRDSYSPPVRSETASPLDTERIGSQGRAFGSFGGKAVENISEKANRNDSIESIEKIAPYQKVEDASTMTSSCMPEDANLLKKPTELVKPCRFPHKTLQRLTFQFEPDFDASRRRYLTSLILAHGGTVMGDDPGIPPSPTISSKAPAQNATSQPKRIFVIHPHEYERTITESQSSSPWPWNHWISGSGRSQPVERPCGYRAAQSITSSWIFGLLEESWRIRKSNREREAIISDLRRTRKKYASRKKHEALLRKSADDHLIDPSNRPLWPWYSLPARKSNAATSMTPAPSPFPGKVVIFLSPQLQQFYATIGTVILSLGGTLLRESNENVTHILSTESNTQQASPRIVSMRWVEQSVRAGFFIQEIDEKQTSPLSARETLDLRQAMKNNSPASPHTPFSLEIRPSTAEAETIGKTVLRLSQKHTSNATLSPLALTTPSPQPLETPRPLPNQHSSHTPNATVPLPLSSTPNSQFEGTLRIAFNISARENIDMPRVCDSLRSLGAAVSPEYPMGAKFPPTHLIASIPSPRPAVLCALARGTWILRPQYAIDCAAKSQLLPEADYEWTPRHVKPQYQLMAVQHITHACQIWRERRLNCFIPANFGAFRALKVLLFMRDLRKRKQFHHILEAGNAFALEIVESMPVGNLSRYSMALLDDDAASELRKMAYRQEAGDETPIHTERWLLCFLTNRPAFHTKLEL